MHVLQPYHSDFYSEEEPSQGLVCVLSPSERSDL